MISIDMMKEDIIKYTKGLSHSFREVEEPWETISLFHGGTTRDLNDILRNGITPRKFHLHNNFIEHPSNEELVYLTTKWHYWYAYNANQESLISQVGKERFESEDIEVLWNETGDFPMYIVCEVPRELLTLDEDVVYQHSIIKKMKSEKISTPSDITIEECLEQGTVASLKTIEPLYINEIIILGSEEQRDEFLNGQYGEEAHKWFSGFGIGSLTAEELNIHEIMTYRKQIYIMENQYPSLENPIVESIQLIDNELVIKTK